MADWSQEHIEIVRELAGRGWSSGEIASRIPGDRSRCAVVGICHREGIELYGNKGGGAIQKSKTSRARSGKRTASPRMADIPASVPLPIDDTAVPPEQRRTVLTLTASCCRWPIGDPLAEGFHFCGALRVPGVSYCDTHARAAYQPALPRLQRARVTA